MKTSVFSPGRINLIGEHTDYNQGYVLPAAIDLGIHLNISLSGQTKQCTFYSEEMDRKYSISLECLPESGSGWENYLLGVLHELLALGAPLQGFDCRIRSTLPVGAGLSSSAALSCGLALGLNTLFGLGLDRLEMAALAQRVENRFAALQCGIMDPFASLMGRSGHFILLDCKSLEYDYIPAEMGAFELVLLDSGVTHELATSGYNQRRDECRQAVAWLANHFGNFESLRDLKPAQWKAVRNTMPEPLRNRCRHVLEENRRVMQAVRALQAGDMEGLGALLYASHQSLSEDYEVSCPELDFLVRRSRDIAGVAGARMMGGGFGGCSLNLVRRTAMPGFIETMRKAYKDACSRDLRAIPVHP